MTGHPGKAPVVLTFLAPAKRCNQRCPACILDQIGEPVSEFKLTPRDYARFIEQFIEASVPIRSVTFQGYEVTLPTSWPYLEAAFSAAQDHRVPRDFVTNGMLLHKWSDRVAALDPRRISISLDGSDAATNDSLRGLPGAFEATLASVKRLVGVQPQLRPRLAVVSTLYPSRNLQSLRQMPDLLIALGIQWWAVGWELGMRGRVAVATHARGALVDELSTLRRAANDAGVRFHVSDDFGFLRGAERTAVGAKTPAGLEQIFRLDPLGYVRSGQEMATEWNRHGTRRWRPSTDDAVEASRYREEPW